MTFEKKMVSKAIEHYQKFLSLWKDADSGLLELEDAREKVAGLKAQSNRVKGFGIRRSFVFSHPVSYLIQAN